MISARPLLYVTLVVALFAFAVGKASTPARAQTVDEWPPGFYELVDNNGQSIRDGVAWCLQNRNPFYWVTNKHCVIRNGKPSQTLYLARPDDKEFIAVHVDNLHATQDIALLHADKPPLFDVVGLETSRKPIRARDHLFTWLRIANATFSRCDGVAITQIRTANGEIGWMTSLHSIPGASGTPIFNNRGMCVGVNSGRIADPDSGEMRQFTIPIDAVYDLVDTVPAR